VHDVFAPNDPHAKQLLPALSAWEAERPGNWGSTASDLPAMTPEEKRALRSLGYTH
jgi:hypothetical protein